MKTVLVEKVETLVKLLLGFPNHYIFRGQLVSNWRLSPALERIFPQEKWNAKTVHLMEEFSLHEFTSRFHLYDRENTPPASKLDWLALMQHYGVPTRLLDFSVSPFLALYFAIENAASYPSSDCAVYAFDYRAVMKESIRVAHNCNPKINLDYPMVQKESKERFHEVIFNNDIDVIWITEPQQLNSRLDRQEGSFMVSGNMGCRLEELLLSKTYSTCDIEKLIISKELFGSIYALLCRMNINSRTVYGDLQGFGKSVRMKMAYYAQ